MTQAFQAAFILHRRPFSDSSFLLEVLSLEHGRQPVMARGARRPRTRFAQLQPFQPLWLGWRGRGEIKSLSHAEPRGAAFRLVEKRLFCGLYLNELVMRMAPRSEPFERLFWIYEEALAALHERAPMEALLRDFELQLLEELGYGMLLTQTMDDRAVAPDAWYLYDAAGGPRLAASGTPQAVRGVTLLAMAQRDFSDSDVRREALRLMRRVIDHYLDHRTLKSRELFSRTR
jgi:DNA repair protein RecO (recombination protein O)